MAGLETPRTHAALQRSFRESIIVRWWLGKGLDISINERYYQYRQLMDDISKEEAET
jgi:hypothetical protein